MKTRHAAMVATLAASSLAGWAFVAPAPAWAHGSEMPAAPAGRLVWPDSSGYTRTERAYTIPDVVLTDSEARPVRLRDLLESGEPVMVNFIFTTCGTICPVMVKVFSEVPGKLGADARRLRMVSISIDPEHDTPARLKAYAREYAADARWRFLTGRVQDISAIQRAFASYRGDKMNHEPVTLLHAAPGKAWVRIDGFASATELANEYRKVLVK